MINGSCVCLPAHAMLAFTAYLVGTASPGPSNLAIMTTAMSRGRTHALALAAGVVNGSLVWGLCAGFGLSSVMQRFSWSLVVMKLLGGAYLLWLAWKAARAARAPLGFSAAAGAAAGEGSLGAAYRSGLAMHLTNPKAIFVWLSIVALALPQGGRTGDALLVVAGCALMGVVVFMGYAVAFSTERARKVYRAAHRWFNATLALVFASAGVRLLLSRTSAA
jgi:threonine efflux protein